MAKTDKAEVSPGFTRARPPGCLYRHQKTGGWYWKVPARYAPPELRGDKKTLYLPMTPARKRRATKIKGIAEVCQRNLWRQWRRAGAPASNDTIETWIAGFRVWHEGTRGAAPRQAADSVRMVRCFVQARQYVYNGSTMTLEAVREPVDITGPRIEDFLAYLRFLGRARRTVQAYRNGIHLFCKFLKRRGELDHNPAADVETATPGKHVPRYLGDRLQSVFLRRLARKAEKWLFDGSRLALYAGPRLGSVIALQWHHVGETALTVPLTKTGDYAIVPLDSPIIGPELAEVLAGMKRGRDNEYVFPVRDLRVWLTEFKKITRPLPVFGELPGTRAGNQFHLLRATWAVNCARRGATLWQLMAWGGWKTAQVVLRYVNVARAGGER